MMKPPSHLGPDGRALFRSVVSDYGVSDAAGLVLVTVACECLDRMKQAQALIAEHGVCIVTDGGAIRPNPAAKVELDARNGLLSAFKALNLDLEPLRDRPGRPAGQYGNGKGRSNGYAETDPA